MPRSRRGRCESSVYCRASDGRWVGSISLGYGGDGKRRRRVVYGETKKAVVDRLNELRGDANAGSIVDSNRLTVGQYLQHWLDTTAKSEVQPTTLAGYEQLVRTHITPHIGGVKLQRLERLHIEQLYARLEAKDVSAHQCRAAAVVLTIALNRAVETEKIPFNPAAKVAKARLPKVEHDVLTDPQVKQFLAAAGEIRLSALFTLAIASGMRQGELLGLKWPDFNFDKGVVTIRRSLAVVKGKFLLKEPKSKTSARTITLPRFAVDAVKTHRAAMFAEGNINAPVFCTREGTHIGKGNLIRQVFKPILKRANRAATELAAKTKAEPALLPNIRFHDLRHTHATSLLSKGFSIKAVSQRLGHSKVDMTLRVYQHVLPSDDTVLAEGLERAYG